MKDADIIVTYRDILAQCHTLLALARSEDWNELVSRQAHYVCRVESLAQAEADVTFSDQTRGQKHDLLIEICFVEGAIRELLDARLRHISRVMLANRQQSVAHNAYESVSRTR